MPPDFSGETIKKILIFGLMLLFSVPFGYYYGSVYWNNGVVGMAMGFVIGAVLTTIGLIIASKIESLFFYFCF